jgi:hypothetical protein
LNGLNSGLHNLIRALRELSARIASRVLLGRMARQALILARIGRGDGARIHADLAETAMETAARYMSEEEYCALEAEVERRLSNNAPAR